MRTMIFLEACEGEQGCVSIEDLTIKYDYWINGYAQETLKLSILDKDDDVLWMTDGPTRRSLRDLHDILGESV